MKKSPFYFEIKTAITQFMAAFNDIFIKRYDKDKNVISTIPVGFVYGPKQRVLEDINNPSKNIVLPAVNVSVSSIRRDSDRVFNKIQGHFINTATNEDKVRHIPQPIPVSIGIKLSIIGRYQEDIEQIISNVSAYCDPYITISWKLPTTENTLYEQEIRSVVQWEGNFNVSFPNELSNSQSARVTADAEFTIKTWIFKKIDTDIGKIYTVKSSFTPSLLTGECFVFTENTDAIKYISSGDPSLTEYINIYAVPEIKDCNRGIYNISRDDPDKYAFSIYGDNFKRVTSVYVLPMNHEPFNIMFDDMEEYFLYENASENIQALYPPFIGRRVNLFNIESDNKITFYLPQEPLISGAFFDIIVANEAGYSRLSVDSRKEQISPEYDWQPAYYGKGIQIIP